MRWDNTIFVHCSVGEQRLPYPTFDPKRSNATGAVNISETNHLRKEPRDFFQLVAEILVQLRRYHVFRHVFGVISSSPPCEKLQAIASHYISERDGDAAKLLTLLWNQSFFLSILPSLLMTTSTSQSTDNAIQTWPWPQRNETAEPGGLTSPTKESPGSLATATSTPRPRISWV